MGITANPTEPWMQQLARNLTMAGWVGIDSTSVMVYPRESPCRDSFGATLPREGRGDAGPLLAGG